MSDRAWLALQLPENGDYIVRIRGGRVTWVVIGPDAEDAKLTPAEVGERFLYPAYRAAAHDATKKTTA